MVRYSSWVKAALASGWSWNRHGSQGVIEAVVLISTSDSGEGCFLSFWLVAQMVKNPPAKKETQVQSLDQEDLLIEGNGYSLQHSCLENSIDRGAWQATVDGISKSWT